MRKKTVFLDRDGTIIEERPYLSNPEEVVLEHGVAHALDRLVKAGFRLVIVSNQSGIGRGYFAEVCREAVQRQIETLLAASHVSIDEWYHCPHTPNDSCNCRKPKPGMLDRANARCPVDWNGSFLIGDKRSDALTAKSRAVNPILLATGHGVALQQWAQVNEVPWLPNISAAADLILS